MAESTLTYRRATVNDIADIVSLLPAAYQDHQSQIGDDHWNKMKRSLSDENQIANLVSFAVGFTCQSQNQLVGIIFSIPSGNPSQIFPADWSYVRLLGVDANYRGLGVGKRLTQLCIEEARQMGEQTIALHTSEFMNPARIMYEGLGFSRVREIEPIYDKRYWLFKLNFRDLIPPSGHWVRSWF